MPVVTAAQSAALLKDVRVPEGFEARIFAAPPAVNYPVFVAAATDGDAAVLDAGYESAAASLWSRLSHQPGPPRLPRPQRRLLGQFGRTLQGLVQIIGKN
jgi:hypothetical protein